MTEVFVVAGAIGGVGHLVDRRCGERCANWVIGYGAAAVTYGLGLLFGAELG